MSVSDATELTALRRGTPSTEMPLLAVAFRWLVGLAALFALGMLLLFWTPTTFGYLLIFAAATILSRALFQIRVLPGAKFTFAPVFVMVYFVIAGGVAAATVEAVSHFASWIISRFRQTSETLLFSFFDIGQHVLSALGGALVVHFVYDRSALFRPVFYRPIESIVLFAGGYLAVHVVLTSISVLTRAGFGEVRRYLWPRATLWSSLSIVASVPFAIILYHLSPEMTWELAIAVVFALVSGVAFTLGLNVRLRQGNEELRALNEIGSQLAATLDVTEIFKVVARGCRSVLTWDGFFIATVNDDNEHIDLVFMTGTGDEVAQRKIPLGAGLTGRAIETGELIHYRRGEVEQGLTDDDSPGLRRPRSIVVAPMKFGGEVLGALSVQNFQSYAYTRSQLQLLQTIAGQAAIAIRNAQLIRSEQKAIAEKEEFLSLVTHELKNPLTSVRGYLDLALDSLKSGRAEEAVESLVVVRDETQRIQRFAEDLLEVSRIGQGRFNVKHEPLDVGEVTEKIVTRYARMRSHQISYHAARNLPRILGDAVRLGQVIENLVSNAVKYSPDGSPIDVTVKREGSHVRIDVADQGMGIPEAQLPLIFERFYRVGDGEHEVKGTGLGLFISREIIRLHHGTITASSTPGNGSVFTVILPIEGTVEAEPEAVGDAEAKSNAPQSSLR